MKKSLTLILTLMMSTMLLAACSSKGTDPKGNTSDGQNTENTEVSDVSQKSDSDETLTTPEPAKPAAALPEIQAPEIEETVLLDQMDVKITATKLESDQFGVTVTLLLENNTDKTLSFLSGTIGYSASSVNGWMIEDGYLNADVAPGKKSNETIRFSKENLELLGISEIADISLAIEIKENYDTYLLTGPMELRTALADSYDYAKDTYQEAIQGDYLSAYEIELVDYEEESAFDAPGLRILSQALVKNKEGGYTLLTELENTADYDLNVWSENFSVNGLMIQSLRWSSDTVLTGKRAVMFSQLTDMTDKNIWNLLGIENIGRVDYALGLQDMEGNELTEAIPVTLTIPDAPQPLDVSGQELYNANGVRIVSKGFCEDDLDFTNDLHLVLLAENGSSGDISIGDVMDSMSINGFMTDCLVSTVTLPAGASGIVDVSLNESYLEDAGVKSMEDITDLEMALEIRDTNYNEIDSPTIRVEQ